MRAAQYAGTLYQKSPESLAKQITDCYEHDKGPGSTPLIRKEAEMPLAVIAPHANYDLSGPCAAWSYKALGDAPQADVYIILAPSHAGLSGTTMEPFATPMGTARVDQELARKIVEKKSIAINQAAFEGEQSVELQLPFLLHLYQQAKIVPLIIGPDIDQQQLAIDIKESLIETNRTAVYIVSCDFTHYGRTHHYVPFSSEIQEKIAELDKGALSYIKDQDPQGLLAYTEKNMTNICGTLPLALLLRLIRAKKVLVEQYYTSSEITEDHKNSVSYASVVFY